MLEESKAIQEDYKKSLCQLIKQSVIDQPKKTELNQKMFLLEANQSASSISKQDIITKFLIFKRYFVRYLDNKKDDQSLMNTESTSSDFILINLKSQYCNATQFLSSFRAEDNLNNDSNLTKSTSLKSDMHSNLIIVKSEITNRLARAPLSSSNYAIEHPSEFLISKTVSEYSSFCTDFNNQDLAIRKAELKRFLLNPGLKESHSELKLEKASTKISSFASNFN